jgi:hypothetical protein
VEKARGEEREERRKTLGFARPPASRTASLLSGVDAVGGNFYVGDAAEGEEEFHEVLGWLFGGLFDDVGDSVGDCGLEGYAAGIEAC